MKRIREGVFSDWMNSAGICAGGAGISSPSVERQDSIMTRSQHLGTPDEEIDDNDADWKHDRHANQLAVRANKDRMSELRLLIRMLVEAAGAPATSPHAMWRDVQSPMHSDRQQLGKLGDRDIDTEGGEEISAHLRDIAVDPEDTWGPVAPTQGDPYVQQDPYVRDWSVLPSSGVKK